MNFFQIIQDKISGNWTFLAFFYSMCTNWPLHLDIYADKSPVPKSITKSASYPATHVSSVTKSLPQILLFLPFIHSLTESLPPLTSTYSKPRCKYSLNQNHHYCDQKWWFDVKTNVSYALCSPTSILEKICPPFGLYFESFI